MRVGVELSAPRAGAGPPYESLVPVGKEGNGWQTSAPTARRTPRLWLVKGLLWAA